MSQRAGQPKRGRNSNAAGPIRQRERKADNSKLNCPDTTPGVADETDAGRADRSIRTAPSAAGGRTARGMDDGSRGTDAKPDQMPPRANVRRAPQEVVFGFGSGRQSRAVAADTWLGSY